jgi:hypothetical protein
MDTLKVFRLGADEYLVTAGKAAVYGDANKAIRVLKELDVDDWSIEASLCELAARGHRVAHFGIQRMFMFTQ